MRIHNELSAVIITARALDTVGDPYVPTTARYRIDDFQESYFVIDDFATLFDLVDRELEPQFAAATRAGDVEPTETLPGDGVLCRGTGRYHRARRAA